MTDRYIKRGGILERNGNTRTIHIYVEESHFLEAKVNTVSDYKDKLIDKVIELGIDLRLNIQSVPSMAWYSPIGHPQGEHVGGGSLFWLDEENLAPVIAIMHELGHYTDIRNYDTVEQMLEETIQ